LAFKIEKRRLYCHSLHPWSRSLGASSPRRDRPAIGSELDGVLLKRLNQARTLNLKQDSDFLALAPANPPALSGQFM
jgi:hypothetical protein